MHTSSVQKCAREMNGSETVIIYVRIHLSRGSPHISQISHWLILVAFGYSWTSTISQNGYNPTLPMAKTAKEKLIN